MGNFMSYVNNFVMEDYFIIFLGIMVLILVVLVLALIKTRNQYYEEISNEFLKRNIFENNNNEMNISNEINNEEEKDTLKEELEAMLYNKNQTNYYDLIDNYEINEEENAVISTDELERRKQEKYDELGVSDNEAMIQRYEEEQEKKAIISYEQLLKNASNIVVSYKEENTENGSPKINKIEVKKKDITEAQSYVEEEQFLKILKDFRTSLP